MGKASANKSAKRNDVVIGSDMGFISGTGDSLSGAATASLVHRRLGPSGMRIGCSNRQLAHSRLILWLALAASGLQAQSVPGRLRGVPNQPAARPAATTPATPAGQPQMAPAPVSQPTSLLQQPAQQARVTLSGASLSIHADNSSLSAILHDIASKSGMKIEGLGSDERVFGTFGPGAPRDVIADLLNGTAYNVVLLGDLNNGAPRELILSPATHAGGAVAAPMAQTNSEDANNDTEPAEPPPQQPEMPPEQQSGAPPANGVKTPQQLFEQLQRMRQNQAQQPQDQQQQQQPPQQ